MRVSLRIIKEESRLWSTYFILHLCSRLEVVVATHPGCILNYHKAKDENRILFPIVKGTRALMQMMGGTLKTKKDLTALERTIEREPWMDEDPEKWSELEVRRIW
jgi:hypothetical protein